MTDPHIAEDRRFCAGCNRAVGRTRGDVPGLTEGFCGKCRHPFSFSAKLRRGDLVAGQYDVAGPIDHGGHGWIYLARDRRVGDRWVALKGLINRGDEVAMSAALAERRSLAEVEHPDIVKIYNFVEHDGDGYIVMEYVNGLSLGKVLDARRDDNANQPKPLPVELAIEYILELLPAVGHLHDLGLLYCDFKPSNVVPTAGALKLIDLGGVYRIDQPSEVYGTAGYSAPEIAHTGPTVASDLFTVARTLVVLCTDFRGYRGTYRYTLPPSEDVELFERYDSLYRFLQRATAADPAERFQSAEEMAAQLLGVQREVVAEQRGAPCPGPSTRFTPERRGSTAAADWRTLPVPLVNPDDPGSAVVESVAATEPEALIEMLDAIPDRSVETEMRFARALLEAGRLDEAANALNEIDARSSEAGDRVDWRVGWYRGTGALAANAPATAWGHFDAVYLSLPGELAPKLALGFAAESTGEHATAARWYDIVSRTDPAFTSAAFGLARCLRALGDRAGAIAAYERVPDKSHAHVDARIAQARELLGGNGVGAEDSEILRAAAIVNGLELDREQRDRLSAEILEAALDAVQRGATVSDPTARVLDCPLVERDVRRGLEKAYRARARHAATAAERIALVDRANRIRPRSLL